MSEPNITGDFERDKWVYEQKNRGAERAHDKLDNFQKLANKAALNAAALTIRTAILVNGGAAIALLAFIGHFPPDQMKAIAGTLSTESFKRNYEQPAVSAGPNTGRLRAIMLIFRGVATIATVISLGLFIYGLFEVRAAFFISS
jgi:hypothetical protein